MLEKLETVNITTKHARDDATVVIIEITIVESKHQMTTVIIGENINLLILIGRTQSHQQKFFIKKVGNGNVKSQITPTKISINVSFLKNTFYFYMHLVACDTTSELFKKEKQTSIRTFQFRSTGFNISTRKLYKHCMKLGYAYYWHI